MVDRPEPAASSEPVGVVETHISTVFLSSDRAYKLLKPVIMPFFDHSDPALRMSAASREYELNRRIAPDVYLGTADVVENGRAVDRMIVMRRLPADRRLAEVIGGPGGGECLRSVARVVAAFHAGEEPVDPAPMATRDAVLGNWDDNFAVIGDHVNTVVPGEEFARVRALAHRYLHRRDALFAARIRAGFVRDGHGDLIADDVFCLDDGPRIIDCLAFADAWRIGDVLLDIAFLVMDVHRLAGEEAAASLLGWYQEFGNEHHPESLAHHYTAYRAHVRAKVACLRHAQGDAASADLAREYHRLALHHLEQGRLRVVMVGGGPGSGKSTLSAGIGAHFGYAVLSTDEIRKDLTATPRSEHRFAAPGEGIYDERGVDAVYREQLRRARLLIEAGRGVVLDGSWSSGRHRAAAAELAVSSGAELFELECRVDPDEARRRVAARMGRPDNLSDATPELVDRLVDRRDPWPGAVRLGTDDDRRRVLDEAIDSLSVIGGRDAE